MIQCINSCWQLDATFWIKVGVSLDPSRRVETVVSVSFTVINTFLCHIGVVYCDTTCIYHEVHQDGLGPVPWHSSSRFGGTFLNASRSPHQTGIYVHGNVLETKRPGAWQQMAAQEIVQRGTPHCACEALSHHISSPTTTYIVQTKEWALCGSWMNSTSRTGVVEEV